MQILLGHDVAVAQWVGEKIGTPIAPPYTAIGFIDRGGTLRVGFVFFRYEPGGNLDFTLAATAPLQRGMLRAVGHYVFEQLGCRRLTSRPRAGQARQADMLKRAGFVLEARLKDYYADDDALQFRLLRRDAMRWMQ